MAGSERDKLKRKAAGKGKRKVMARPLSGTPPREAEPFSERERRRLLQALRECAQAVDAASPGGRMLDRVKMEGLLRCLTHSISLLEKDPRHPLERRRSSSALETDQAPSSSRESSLICRGPNLNSALTSINLVKNKVCRHTCSSQHIKRSNVQENSSSSTICEVKLGVTKTPSKTQTKRTNSNEHDGDESSNGEMTTTSSLMNSDITILHFDIKNECEKTASENDNIDSDVQAASDSWLSSYPPSPTCPQRLFENSPIQIHELMGDDKAMSYSENDTSGDETSFNALATESTVSNERKGKRLTQSESVSPRYSFSAKKEDISIKPLRKSAPQERTPSPNKKVGRERSVYTVRKHDPLNSSPKKRPCPREGDPPRTRGRDKSILHHFKESIRDSLMHSARTGSTESKIDKFSEIMNPKQSSASLLKSSNLRHAEKRIKTADSTSSKRTVRRRPRSRSSLNKGKSLPETSSVKTSGGLVDIPIKLTDSVAGAIEEKKQEAIEKPLSGGTCDKLKISVIQLDTEVENKTDLATKKRGAGKRLQKSRKPKTKEKMKSATSLKKGHYHILPSSAPSRRDDKTLLLLEKPRSLSRLSNQVSKTNSESRFTASPKRHLKVSSELMNTPPTKAPSVTIAPRLTNSDRKMERKAESLKRTSIVEKPSSRTSLRQDEIQFPISPSYVLKAISRASDGKVERKSPTNGTKRGLKRRHSGPLINKAVAKSPPLSSKRSNRSSTRSGARSAKTSDDGSTSRQFQNFGDNLSKHQNRSQESKGGGKMRLKYIARGLQRSLNGSPVRGDTKKLQLKKSNSGSKSGLDKNSSANSISKEEKNKSGSVKQKMGILQKSASYPETVADDSNASTLTQEIANDFRKLLKQKSNFGKEHRGISPTEKFSSSDLRRLLTQSATKKKRVTFACFDQLQPPCVRRLKTDYIDKAQKNVTKPSDYIKLRHLIASPGSSSSTSPTNESKRFIGTNKPKISTPDNKENKFNLPSVTKQLKSILLTANKANIPEYAKEEMRHYQHCRPMSGTSLTISGTRYPSGNTHDAAKLRCIPNIFTRYLETVDTGDIPTKKGLLLYSPNNSYMYTPPTNPLANFSGDSVPKCRRKSLGRIPLFKSSNYQLFPHYREKPFNYPQNFIDSYGAQSDIGGRLFRTKSQ